MADETASYGETGYDAAAYGSGDQTTEYGGSGYDAQGGYYDDQGGYYDDRGGYYDAQGGYYDAQGGYYDASGNYYDQNAQGGDGDGDGYDDPDNAVGQPSGTASSPSSLPSSSLMALVPASGGGGGSGGFGDASLYATPRPGTPPAHWREREMTKRVYDRVNQRRVRGILATAGMQQLKRAVTDYDQRVSKGQAILRSKRELRITQAIDASRRETVHQTHVSQLLMRSVETQQANAARLKMNQDVARQDLLKQLPTLSSVQERVHRLRSLYTSTAAKESTAAAAAASDDAKPDAHDGPPAGPKPVVSAKVRVREELRAMKPMPVSTVYQHLKGPDALEQMLESKRNLTSGRKMVMPGHHDDHSAGKAASGNAVDLNDPYAISRLLQETKLRDLLRAKGRKEAEESGIDPETGCIVPQCPLRVQAVAVGPSVIQLSWDPPIFDGGQPIMDYIVYFTPCTVEHVGKRVKKSYGAEEHFFTTRWFKKDAVAHHGYTWRFRQAESTVSNIYVSFGTGCVP
jgi:hypothetical protein